MSREKRDSAHRWTDDFGPGLPGECEDRRWGPRKSLGLDVWIYQNDRMVAKGRSRDIGLEGMFVETDFLAFSKDVEFEIEFLLNAGQQPRRYRLPAIVMHLSRDGIGIMFMVFDQAEFRALEAALRTRGIRVVPQ